MVCNLKALGLALLVALSVLSLIGASAAHALTADVPGGQTTTGQQISVGEHEKHSFNLMSGRGFHCNTAIFEGTIENGAAEITVTPLYSNCFSNETQPTTVTHNGCNYRIYGGEEAGTDHFNNITIDLVCPMGKEIEIHVYSNTTNHTSGIVLCTFTIPPFVGNHSLTLENTTSGIDDVNITATITGVAKRVTGSALLCGPAEQNGVYTGASTVRAYKDTAHTEQVDLSMTY